MYPVDKCTIVAVDYTPTMRRIVTDKLASWFVTYPDDYDASNTQVRIVWTSISTDDIYSTPIGLYGNIDNGWGILGSLSYSRRVIHH